MVTAWQSQVCTGAHKTLLVIAFRGSLQRLLIPEASLRTNNSKNTSAREESKMKYKNEEKKKREPPYAITTKMNIHANLGTITR